MIGFLLNLYGDFTCILQFNQQLYYLIRFIQKFILTIENGEKMVEKMLRSLKSLYGHVSDTFIEKK